MVAYLQQLAASAARAELIILHAAPVLLESLAQLHALLQSRNSSNSAAHIVKPLLTMQGTRAACSNAADSRKRLLQHSSSAAAGASSSMKCSYAQHRTTKPSSSTSNCNYVIHASTDDSKHAPASTSYSSNSSNSSSSSSSSASPEGHHDRQGAYRRGFGAKVALPSADVLHEVLIGEPAVMKMRAYHIGARIHIGQVAQRAQQEGCRINSGKDYCIIWLNPSKHKFQSSSSSSSSSELSSSAGGDALHPHLSVDPAIYERLQTLRRQLLSRAFPPISKKQQAQQHERRRHTPPRWSEAAPRLHSPLLGSVNKDISSSSSSSHVQPLLAVYRYGAVVCAGTCPEDEPGLVEEYVPGAVRYKPGGDSTWAQPNPMLQSRSPVEEHTVRVVPHQLEHIKKGTDQVLLRVLDIGGVRVLTSVLAQSAALKFYETSVAEALDKLAQYRGRVRAAQADRTGWYGSAAAAVASMSGEQEATFFKVIAASALVMKEARELLEMAEPAWQYAAYHSIWALTADDFELERRFKGLELKLRQVEKEAKHDVKHRAGRRYHRLEQSVVWLLVVSCLLAVLDVSKKALAKRDTNSNSTQQQLRSTSRSDIEDGSEAAVDTAAAATTNVTEWAGVLQDEQAAAEQQYNNTAAEITGSSCDLEAAVAGADPVAVGGDTVRVDAGAERAGVDENGSRYWLWWRQRRHHSNAAQQP